MSKYEIKYQISNALDEFSLKAVKDLLSFLNNVEKGDDTAMFNLDVLSKILDEDQEILEKISK